MELIPAIDLRDGMVVRLRQGDFERESVHGLDPVAVAQRWAGEGASRLHLVDLDGARAPLWWNGSSRRSPSHARSAGASGAWTTLDGCSSSAPIE
jgi:phosphoribosylformimino-5-aminoimidazole carboxamide ribonucleotide (ProFAR) isomerase